MVHGRAREPPRQTWLGAVDEGKVRVSSTEITGQVRVRAMQAGQTRSCGVRAHTHKPPRTLSTQGLWGPHEQYLSDPWAPGHAVLCVWKPE